MYLSSFKLRDFRSYRTVQELRLNPELTILAGRNNVGKTALLRGLRLLQEHVPGAGSSFRAEFIWALSHDELGRAFPAGVNTVLAEYVTPRKVYELQAVFGQEPQYTNINTARGHLWKLADQFLLEAKIVDSSLYFAPHVITTPNAAPTLEWQWKGEDTSRQEILDQWWNLISSLILSSYYIHPRRTGSQSQLFEVTEGLAPDGANLTTVLATLSNNYRFTTFEQIQQFMRAAFPEITRIEVQMAPGGNNGGTPITRAQIQVVYGESGGLTVPLEHCGTGIEQMLMLATAILTAKTPRLFLIDEPHAFLHPAAERSLLQFIQDHPQHQYVVATHSPVFLNAFPLTQTRLITIGSDGSQINDVQHAAQILDEVGITAADLWSTDAMLWIEGASDVATMEEIIAGSDGWKQMSCRVVAMPDLMRSVSTSANKARQAVEFCESVREAISPIRVESLFVFDGDEKPDRLKEDIRAATAGRARFLLVRELENLFLSPPAIHAVLSEVCADAGTEPPSLEQIARDIEELVMQTGNHKMYKHDPGKPDEAKVVGSQVLHELWWKWALTQYDKVRDGRELAKAVSQCDPARLEPLRAFLGELVEMVRTKRKEASG